MKQKVHESWQSVLESPIGDHLKINVYAATQGGSGHMGTGVMIWNCRGELMGALALPIKNCWNVISAELLAIRKAIGFYLEAGFFHGDIISDSMLAIRLIQQSLDSLELFFRG